MAISLEKLMKTQENVDDLAKDLNQKGSYKDDRFFTHTMKDEAASVRMRFLPSKEEDINHVVSRYEHIFAKNGMFLREICPTSFTQGKHVCPICDHNNATWDTPDYDKIMKRRHRFFANVYIIKNPNNPETEGKVYLYEFGDQIWRVIMKKLKPTKEEQLVDNMKPVNVFSLTEGCDFKLKVSIVDKQVNYASSSFEDTPNAFMDGDMKKIEPIYNTIYPLSEFVDKKKVKTYDELLKKFEDIRLSKAPKKSLDQTLNEKASAPSTSTTTGVKLTETTKPIVNVPTESPKSTISKSEEEEIDANIDELFK